MIEPRQSVRSPKAEKAPALRAVRVAQAGGAVPFEIQQSGTPTSRTCKVIVQPVMREGGTRAPVLTFATGGPNAIDELSVSLEDDAKYSDAVIVFNNERTPFKPTTYKLSAIASISPSAFLIMPIVTAARSGQPFHVTAKHADAGGLVSSRFEGFDVDELLRKLGDRCLFDVESYLGSADAASLEAGLDVSDDDLQILRWVLLKKYGGQPDKPDYRSSLSDGERKYLKKYFAEKGMGPSGYLTSTIVTILKSDASLMNIPPEEPPPAPAEEPAPVSTTFVFKLCNTSKHVIAAAIAGKTLDSPDDFRVAGWYIVGRGDCEVLGTFQKGWIYFYGEKKDSGGRVFWGGKKSKDDAWVCVNYPGPFDRAAPGKCSGKRRKGFTGKWIDAEAVDSTGVYSWTMYD